jgi:hypothetical protein
MKQTKKNKNTKSKLIEVSFSIESTKKKLFQNEQYVYFLDDMSEQYKIVGEATVDQYYTYMYSKKNISMWMYAADHSLNYYSLLKPSTNELVFTSEHYLRSERDNAVTNLEIRDIFSKLKTQEARVKYLEASNSRLSTLSTGLFCMILIIFTFFIFI